MKRSAIVIGATVAVAAAVACGADAVAQERTAPPTSSADAYASRAELEARLQRLDEQATSEARGDSVRLDADRIRARLRHGDFQVGDRILLEVEGEDVPSDTLRVRPGRVVIVRGIGEIPLEGVLRSELEDHLAAELRRFINEPIVRAQPLIRLAVAGEVGQPGFYVLPAEALLSDLLMTAGGATQEAAMDDIRIERGDRRVHDGAATREAMVRGHTIAQLKLRAGDRIVVPERDGGMSGSEMLRLVLVSLPGLAVVVSRLF